MILLLKKLSNFFWIFKGFRETQEKDYPMRIRINGCTSGESMPTHFASKWTVFLESYTILPISGIFDCKT